MDTPALQLGSRYRVEFEGKPGRLSVVPDVKNANLVRAMIMLEGGGDPIYIPPVWEEAAENPSALSVLLANKVEFFG